MCKSKFRVFIKSVLLLAALTSVSGVKAQAVSLGIVTGSESGTYIKFGYDLKELLSRYDINLEVHNSAGSLENVYSIYKLPKAQLGIVQSDVLAFIKTRPDESVRKTADKIRLVHPLYNEEVHLLASSDVTSFEDLEGRKVAIGVKGSGTYLSADTMLKLAGINITPVEKIGKEALDALKAGEIDAMIYIAGIPVKLFEDEVSEKDDLHFLPILNKDISEIYNVSSKIPKETYQFMDRDIDTIAVKAVLITYAYKRTNCSRVGNVANIISDNIEWLRENGHPKWQSVDLGFKLNGWEQYECVQTSPSNNTDADADATGLGAFLDAVSRQ